MSEQPELKHVSECPINISVGHFEKDGETWFQASRGTVVTYARDPGMAIAFCLEKFAKTLKEKFREDREAMRVELARRETFSMALDSYLDEKLPGISPKDINWRRSINKKIKEKKRNGN